MAPSVTTCSLSPSTLGSFAPKIFWPPFRDAVLKGADVDAEIPRKISYPYLLASISHHIGAGNMALLLHRSGPPAVARLIVSIAVDTVKSAPLWPFAHIAQKILKLLPSIADRNPSPPICREFRCLRILAALPHTLPSYIGSALRSGRRVTMLPRDGRVGALAPTKQAAARIDNTLQNMEICATFSALAGNSWEPSHELKSNFFSTKLKEFGHETD